MMNKLNIHGLGIGLAALLMMGCAMGSKRPADLPLTERETYVATEEIDTEQEGIGRVVELRGEHGELARISLGCNEGAARGKTVEFFVLADYSDLMEDGKKQPSPVGYGVIAGSESQLSWVEVTHPEREVVRRGHYVRIAPQQPGTPLEKVKGLFKKKKDKQEQEEKTPAEE